MSAGLAARSSGATIGDRTLDVDLEVAPGETIAVLGPNGAGKTTLLRVLAGLLPIDAGTVALDGEILDDGAGACVAPERRRVGVVFQDLLLFPHLSVAENVAFGIRARGGRRGPARARRGRCARPRSASPVGVRTGPVRSRAGRPSGSPSPGRWPPTLASCSSTSPSRPSTPRPGWRCAGTSGGTSTRIDGVRIVVTHDPLEAMALADRLVVVEDGRVVQEGSGAELAARPRSPYVADLVGVNLLEGEGAGRVVRLSGCAGPERDRGDVRRRPGLRARPPSGAVAAPRRADGESRATSGSATP